MRLARMLSYLMPITVLRLDSAVSGPLDIRWENGRLALNGPHVNYSFNRLHKVMATALKATRIHERREAKILNLGMGAGSSVEIIRERLGLDHPIVSVEVDPVIIAVAESHFDIRRHRDHDIVQQDAYYFMEVNRDVYDLIIVDLFIDAVVPEKFRQLGFMENVIKALRPGGQVIFNYLKCAGDEGYAGLLDSFPGEWTDVKGVVTENEVLLYSSR